MFDASPVNLVYVLLSCTPFWLFHVFAVSTLKVVLVYQFGKILKKAFSVCRRYYLSVPRSFLGIASVFPLFCTDFEERRVGLGEVW